jgi:hypothetical protein
MKLFGSHKLLSPLKACPSPVAVSPYPVNQTHKLISMIYTWIGSNTENPNSQIDIYWNHSKIQRRTTLTLSFLILEFIPTTESYIPEYDHLQKQEKNDSNGVRHPKHMLWNSATCQDLDPPVLDSTIHPYELWKRQQPSGLQEFMLWAAGIMKKWEMNIDCKNLQHILLPLLGMS